MLTITYTHPTTGVTTTYRWGYVGTAIYEALLAGAVLALGDGRPE